jgi:hypothetical protein
MFARTRLIGNNRSVPLASPFWHTRSVSRWQVNKYCWAAGIDPDRLRQRGICSHSLCRTSIKDAVRNGVQMHEVPEFAGPSQIQMTELCFERNEEYREVVARRIQMHVPECQAGDK